MHASDGCQPAIRQKKSNAQSNRNHAYFRNPFRGKNQDEARQLALLYEQLKQRNLAAMFLTYGQDEHNALLHIADAQSGNACGLRCPFCGEPLTARKGTVLAHHFAHQSNSCRSIWSSGYDFIPSYEGYYLFGLTKPQQRALREIINTHQAHTFYADTLKSVTFESLRLKNFLSLVRHQPDERDRLRPVTRITDKAKAFAAQFSLLEFATFMRTEFEHAHQSLQEKGAEHDYQIALRILARELERVEQTTLYFIEITTDTQILHRSA